MKAPLGRRTLLAILSAFLVGCSSVGSGQKQLEYRVETVWVKPPTPVKDFQEYLNVKANEGWNLVGFEEHDNNFRVVLSRTKR
jgi:hypothetical protein